MTPFVLTTRLLLGLVLLAAVLCAPTPADARAEPLEPAPELRTGTLDNGLRFAIHPCDDPATSLSILLEIDAGSLFERDDERGAARIAAGLIPQGTRAIPGPEIARRCEAVGLSVVRDMRSVVAYRSLVIQVDLPRADQPVDPGPLLEYFASLLHEHQGLAVTAQRVATERDHVTSTDAATTSASSRLSARVLPIMLEGQRIAHRSPRDIPGIENTGADQVAAFIKRRFRPAHARLVITGDLRQPALLDAITDAFGSIPPRSTIPLERQPVRTKERPIVAIEHDPQVNKDVVQLITFTNPAPPVVDDASARTALAEQVAFAALSDRMAELAGDQITPVRIGGAYAASDDGLLRVASLIAVGDPGAWPGLMRASIIELRRVAAHGFDEALLASTGARLIALLEREVEAERSSASALAARIADDLARGDLPRSAAQRVAFARRTIKTLTPPELAAVVKERLNPRNAGYLIVTAEPTTQDPEALHTTMNAALDAVPAPVALDPAPTRLIPPDPQPAPIERFTVDADSRAVVAQFQGGVRLHVRTLDNTSGRVGVALAISGGKIHEDQATRGLTQALASLWTRPAIGGHAPGQTRRTLGAAGVSLRGAVFDDALCIIAEGPVEQLDLMLQVVRGIIDNPAPHARSLVEYRTIASARAGARDQQPEGALERLIDQAIVPPDNPRHAPLSADELIALSIEDVAAWGHAVFQTGALEIAIAGDIARASALERAALFLGAVKRPINVDERAARSRPMARGPIFTQAERTLVTGRAAVAVGFHSLDVVEPRDRILAEIAADAISKRLTKRLRKAGPLAPVLRAETRPAFAHPLAGRFQLVGVTAPADARALAVAMRAELDAAAAEPLTPAELRAAALQVAGAIRSRFQSEGAWAQAFALAAVRSAPPETPEQTLALIEAATAADIRAFFRRFDQPHHRYTVIVEPAGRTE